MTTNPFIEGPIQKSRRRQSAVKQTQASRKIEKARSQYARDAANGVESSAETMAVLEENRKTQEAKAAQRLADKEAKKLELQGKRAETTQRRVKADQEKLELAKEKEITKQLKMMAEQHKHQTKAQKLATAEAEAKAAQEKEKTKQKKIDSETELKKKKMDAETEIEHIKAGLANTNGDRLLESQKSLLESQKNLLECQKLGTPAPKASIGKTNNTLDTLAEEEETVPEDTAATTKEDTLAHPSVTNQDQVCTKPGLTCSFQFNCTKPGLLLPN